MILQKLRAGTADLHEALETALPLGSADLSGAEYGQVLVGFRGFFAPWEREAKRRAPAAFQPLLQERTRLPLLDMDLQALGLAPAAEAIHPSTLPRFEDGGELLGSLYVLEGSRLGGQVIARRAEQRLGLTREAGTAFFTGFGAETGSRWRAFCNVLEQWAPRYDEERMVAAARQTFEAFRLWMAPAKEERGACQ